MATSGSVIIQPLRQPRGGRHRPCRANPDVSIFREVYPNHGAPSIALLDTFLQTPAGHFHVPGPGRGRARHLAPGRADDRCVVHVHRRWPGLLRENPLLGPPHRGAESRGDRVDGFYRTNAITPAACAARLYYPHCGLLTKTNSNRWLALDDIGLHRLMRIGTDSLCLQFGTKLRQALRKFVVDEGDQPLAHMAARVPIA